MLFNPYDLLATFIWRGVVALLLVAVAVGALVYL